MCSSSYIKNDNSLAVFHKIKGIPIDVQSKRVFVKLSSAVIKKNGNHRYFIESTKNSHLDHTFIYSIEFSHFTSFNHIVGSIRLKDQYTHHLSIFSISSANKKECQLRNREPLATNESTLIIQRDDSIVFAITKGKRELLFSYYDEISPMLACFLVQTIIFEGFFSSVV